MGAYSTLQITRGKAIEVMMRELHSEPSNDTLERFMDEYLESRLYNCTIVPDGYDNDDEVV